MIVPLCDRQGGVRAEAIVDPTDYAYVRLRRWHLTTGGYARSFEQVPGRSSARAIYMHRLICGLTEGDGLKVDHINGDKLDNRRKNLRAVDQSVNLLNRGHADGSGASRIRGVYFSARDRKWRGQIKIRGKVLSLGSHATEQAAEAAVRAWRLAHDPQPRWLASLGAEVEPLASRRADP